MHKKKIIFDIRKKCENLMEENHHDLIDDIIMVLENMNLARINLLQISRTPNKRFFSRIANIIDSENIKDELLKLKYIPSSIAPITSTEIVNPTPTNPTETKPTETKPTETKSTPTKPTETKSTPTKPTETKPTETKSTQTKSTETKPIEHKSAIHEKNAITEKEKFAKKWNSIGSPKISKDFIAKIPLFLIKKWRNIEYDDIMQMSGIWSYIKNQDIQFSLDDDYVVLSEYEDETLFI